MKWVVIHRDKAKQMIVIFGDGFPWPVAIHITDLKIFETSAKRAFVSRHVASLHRRVLAVAILAPR